MLPKVTLADSIRMLRRGYRNSHLTSEQVDSYIAQHSDAQFSHGICPACFDNVVAQLDR